MKRKADLDALNQRSLHSFFTLLTRPFQPQSSPATHRAGSSSGCRELDDPAAVVAEQTDNNRQQQQQPCLASFASHQHIGCGLPRDGECPHQELQGQDLAAACFAQEEAAQQARQPLCAEAEPRSDCVAQQQHAQQQAHHSRPGGTGHGPHQAEPATVPQQAEDVTANAAHANPSFDKHREQQGRVPGSGSPGAGEAGSDGERCSPATEAAAPHAPSGATLPAGSAPAGGALTAYEQQRLERICRNQEVRKAQGGTASA